MIVLIMRIIAMMLPNKIGSHNRMERVEIVGLVLVDDWIFVVIGIRDFGAYINVGLAR
ncbi:MAG: hypothetical protein NPIRA02_27870 [Nitrospirales bacterium]|nr:MAG: hypothetical protein NPIRA02_27870 [Nitrospirales bacterium]